MAATVPADIAATCFPPRESVDLALRAAAVLLESGASGYGSEVAVGQIATCIAPADTSFTFAGNLVAAHSRNKDGPFSLVRTVTAGDANLDRASELEMFAEQVASGEVAHAAIPGGIDRIAAIPDPYRPREIALAAVAAGIAWAMLLGGGIPAALLAVASSLAGFAVQRRLRRWDLGQPLVVLLAATAASLVAAAGVRAGFVPASDAAFIPAIAWLIPGLTFINGLIDLLSIRHTALGLQRTVVALILFMLIGAAIAIGVAAGGN